MSIIEAVQIPFMARALLVGVLIGGIAGYCGVFLVQRGLSSLGSGLSHAAFGGVALGLLLDVEPLWMAIPFTLLVAVLMTWVRESTQISHDAIVGVFFSAAMALGVVFLAFKENYSAEAFGYIFGSILAVAPSDIVAACGLLGITLVMSWQWSRWTYATFDRTLARADRIDVVRDDLFLTLFTALTVVVSVKIMGVVLLSAFLVIPAATARLWAQTFWQMTWIAIGLGVATSVVGLVLSFYLDLPSGAAIVLLQSSLFGLTVLWRSVHSR